MMDKIIGIVTLYVIAFVLMFVIVFRDMFVWMWHNPDKIWKERRAFGLGRAAETAASGQSRGAVYPRQRSPSHRTRRRPCLRFSVRQFSFADRDDIAAAGTRGFSIQGVHDADPHQARGQLAVGGSCCLATEFWYSDDFR